MERRQADRYDGVARFLHWCVLALVVVQFATRWVPPDVLPDVGRQQLHAWHYGVGPAVLLLMVVRLGWRATHEPPPSPADLPAIMRFVSRATHWLLYAVLLLLPVLGWLSASGYGAGATLLGLPLPALVSPDRALGRAAGGLHGTLAWVLLALLSLHVAGALYHALVLRDGVLGRMLPGRARPAP